MNVERDELIMGIPSNGRLLKGCEGLLKEANFQYLRNNKQVFVRAEFGQNKTLSIALMAQEDIIKKSIAGDIDLGVVGSDRLFETYPNFYDKFVTDRPEGLKTKYLSFDRGSLVVAVPEEYPTRWGVDTLSTLGGKKVGTNYPRTTRGFFLDRAIRDVKIEEANDPVEGMIKLGWTNAIATLVDNEESLRENGLRKLSTISNVRALLLLNLDSPISLSASKILYEVSEKLVEADRQIVEKANFEQNSAQNQLRNLNSGSFWNS